MNAVSERGEFDASANALVIRLKGRWRLSDGIVAAEELFVGDGAAVIVGGFTGLGMGATPVGIANMNAVTSKYGPSAKAFLVIPLVGAFFLDLLNALVIKTFIGLPFMQAAVP